jgi:hypothetical protein
MEFVDILVDFKYQSDNPKQVFISEMQRIPLLDTEEL